ncbi:MAG: hypothetical protein ACOX6T_26090 [Myxococcales bacterium]
MAWRALLLPAALFLFCCGEPKDPLVPETDAGQQDKCDAVSCSAGETCEPSTGLCACSPGSCPAPQVCGVDRRCVELCAGVTCEAGETCNPKSGACECSEESCPSNRFCDPTTSRCATRCTEGSCAPGDRCEPATGVCRCDPEVCTGELGACDPRTNHCTNLCKLVDCPEGETCEQATGECRCTEGSCPAGMQCDGATRRCVDRCRSCNPGETCDPETGVCSCDPATCTGAVGACDPETGRCVNRCAGFECPEGETCDPLVGDGCRCTEDSCPAGFLCDPLEQHCVDVCAELICPDGESCNPETVSCECAMEPVDTCTAANPTRYCDPMWRECLPFCWGVYCDVGETCVPTTGACQCTTAPDSCPSGKWCDPATLECATDWCSFVTCNAGETCDPAVGACECDDSSCPTNYVCNAERRCELAVFLCDTVTCPIGESCDPETGLCGCDAASCPAGQFCDTDRHCAPIDLCLDVGCADGETCDPADGLCKCTATSCPNGQVCGAEGHCLVSCGGSQCEAGQGCFNPVTQAPGGITCTCLPRRDGPGGETLPDTCAVIGKVCDYNPRNPSASSCVMPVELSPCQPGTGCASGYDCQLVRDPVMGTHLCLTPCASAGDCPAYHHKCYPGDAQPSGLAGHCWWAYCARDAQGNPIPGEYFQPCDNESRGDGTCVPLNTWTGTEYVDIGYCWAGGTRPVYGMCTDMERHLVPEDERCVSGAFCYQGSCTSWCNAALNPNPQVFCGPYELCYDADGVPSSEGSPTAHAGICW